MTPVAATVHAGPEEAAFKVSSSLFFDGKVYSVGPCKVPAKRRILMSEVLDK